MEKSILHAISSISLIFLLSCSSRGDNANQSGIDTMVIGTNLSSHFTNQNEVNYFFKVNDTLFCKIKNGVKFYDPKKDAWLMAADTSKNNYKEIIEPIDQTKMNCPVGYKGSIYVNFDKIHQNWYLISNADEGAIYNNQDLVDTITKCVYSFPYEGIHDFYIDQNLIWIGTDYGISKIDKKTCARKEYLTLPAFKQVKQVFNYATKIIYLDFHYGLFNYNKTTHIVTPYLLINKLAYSEDLKFHNAMLIGDIIYILSTPMGRCGDFIGRKAILLAYNLKNNTLSRYEPKIPYFDAFLKYKHYLLCYGERQEYYEGGATSYFGGAIALDLNNNKIIELTDIPLVNLQLDNNVIKATSILVNEFEVYYKYLMINSDFNVQHKITIVQRDSLYGDYTRNKKDGDTIRYNGIKMINNIKKVEEFTRKYAELKKQRAVLLDSSFFANPVFNSEITMDRQQVTHYKY